MTNNAGSGVSIGGEGGTSGATGSGGAGGSSIVSGGTASIEFNNASRLDNSTILNLGGTGTATAGDGGDGSGGSGGIGGSATWFGRSATIAFKYARYFAAPGRARTVYGSDIAYERALAVGQVRPDGALALLPSTRPYPDVLQAQLSAAGTYLVAAPQ